MSKLYARVLSALATVETAEAYEGLKIEAEGLSTAEQFAVIDGFIACRNRLVEMGVL